MEQKDFRAFCWFCDSFFSNYEEVALKDACRMEHIVSDETLERLIHYIGTIEKVKVKKKK